MDLPTKIITADKLCERWFIDYFDLFWVIFNYDLCPVEFCFESSDWKYHEWGDDEDNYAPAVDLYLDTEKNLSGLRFKIDDVEKFEENRNLDSVKRIKGADLITRWNVVEDELLDLVLQGFIRTADVFGQPFPLEDYGNFLLRFDTTLIDLYFDLSAVEEFEKNHDMAQPRVDTQTASKPETAPQRRRRKVREVASPLWITDPSITIEDMIMRDEITIAAERPYSESTLRNWIKDLCPNRQPGRRPKK